MTTLLQFDAVSFGYGRRRLLQEAALPNVHAAKTMNEAAEMVVALAAGRDVGVQV